VENFKTSDLALASYLYCLGGSLVDIDRRNPGRCVFIFELTPQQQEAVAKWQDGTATVNASFFWNSFRNRIQWTPGADGKWSPQNLSEARSVGLELEMQTNTSFLGLHDLFSLGARYTFLKARDMLERQLIYRPEHSLGYNLRVGTEKLWAQIQGIYQSRRYTTLQNTKWLDPFTKYDAQIGIERSFTL